MIDRLLLDELLNQPEETSQLDFKREIRLSSDKDKIEFTKDVSALANTEGGHIVYGKEDREQGGRIVGIDPTTYNPDQMQQIIAQRCNPPPEFRTVLIERNAKYFVLLYVPESRAKPHEIIRTREVWIRRGGISDRATQKEREKMSLESQATPKTKEPTLKEQLEMEGVREEAESWFRRNVIRLGRWYTLRKYGKLDVTLQKEIILLAIIGILLFVPIVFVLLQTTLKREVPNYWILVSSVVLAVFGVIPFRVLEILPKLKCPECGKQFSIRRTGRIRVKDKPLPKIDDRLVREITYRNIYSCEYCDYSDKKFEIEKETIRAD